MKVVDRMELRALDSGFNVVEIIDAHDSVLWADRYNKVGDFEIHGAISDQLLTVVNSATYVFNPATKGVGILETPTTEYKLEDPDTLTLKGRNLECVLERRIIEKGKTLLNPADRRISKILCDLIIEAFGPSNPARYWDRLIVEDRTYASPMLAVDAAMTIPLGTNLLKLVEDLTSAYDLGFGCEYDLATQKVKIFIYQGVDRTQKGSDLVVFSDLFDNLITAKYELPMVVSENAVLVAGKKIDPVTGDPVTELVTKSSAKGIERRETFLETDEEGLVYLGDETQREMTPEEYAKALKMSGESVLAISVYQTLKDFEGEIVESDTCEYGTHFGLGDKVVFHSVKTTPVHVRVDGVVFSDEAGATAVEPEFSFVRAYEIDDGRFVKVGCYSVGSSLDTLAAFEEKVGVKQDYMLKFISFTEDIPTILLQDLSNRGVTPILTIEPWGMSLHSISVGAHDEKIIQFARDLAAANVPVILRVMHEMNGTWYPWGYPNAANPESATNTPALFISAYNRICSTIRMHAPKIEFVWCPNAEGAPWGEDPQVAPYYPGDAYVDYMGIDGYNLDSASVPWRSFRTTIQRAYDAMVELSDKPILIVETASRSRTASASTWVREMFADLRTRFTRIVGVCWFDHPDQEYAIDGDEGTLDAYADELSMLSANVDIIRIPAVYAGSLEYMSAVSFENARTALNANQVFAGIIYPWSYKTGNWHLSRGFLRFDIPELPDGTVKFVCGNFHGKYHTNGGVPTHLVDVVGEIGETVDLTDYSKIGSASLASFPATLGWKEYSKDLSTLVLTESTPLWLGFRSADDLTGSNPPNDGIARTVEFYEPGSEHEPALTLTYLRT